MIRFHYDGLIGSQLQIVTYKLLKDIVVNQYLRCGGLKLNRSEFILVVLLTVFISGGVEKHNPV